MPCSRSNHSALRAIMLLAICVPCALSVAFCACRFLRVVMINLGSVAGRSTPGGTGVITVETRALTVPSVKPWFCWVLRISAANPDAPVTIFLNAEPLNSV